MLRNINTDLSKYDCSQEKVDFFLLNIGVVDLKREFVELNLCESHNLFVITNDSHSQRHSRTDNGNVNNANFPFVSTGL